jgi:hypothetical protein
MHRWLIAAGSEATENTELADICRDFAHELEPLLEASLIDAQIGSRIWSLFRSLTVAAAHDSEAPHSHYVETNMP